MIKYLIILSERARMLICHPTMWGAEWNRFEPWSTPCYRYSLSHRIQRMLMDIARIRKEGLAIFSKENKIK